MEDVYLKEWKQDQLQRELQYIGDKVFGNYTSLEDREEVPQRPCTVESVVMNDREYKLYRYRDHVLFIPKDISDVFDQVIRFSSSERGYCYSSISYDGETLTEDNYTFSMEGQSKEAVELHRLILSRQVSPSNFQKSFLEAGTPELFFAGKRYNTFFSNGREAERQSITLRRRPSETSICIEDVSDIFASLKRHLNNEEVYTTIQNQDSPLFEIVEELSEFKSK